MIGGGRVKQVPNNEAGLDYIFGDIHGYFTQFEQCLRLLRFNEATDRAILLGDLVDRGSESKRSLEFLDKSWLEAVQGNHEVMTINSFNDPASCQEFHVEHGGRWFEVVMNREGAAEARKYAERFEQMPLAIELTCGNKKIGLVHADVPYSDWDKFIRALEQGTEAEIDNHVIPAAQWSKQRVKKAQVGGPTQHIAGIDLAVFGHTIVRRPLHDKNWLALDVSAYSNNQLACYCPQTTEVILFAFGRAGCSEIGRVKLPD